MHRLEVAAALVAVGLLPGCASGVTGDGTAAHDQSKTIGKSTFADWPLTVDSGVLKCAGSGGVGKVTIVVSGKPYALNGSAKGDKANLDIQSIWADEGTAGLKRDIGPLIQDGLRLCK